MLFKLAFVLIALAPLLVLAPLCLTTWGRTSRWPLSRWLDPRFEWVAGGAGIVWLLALLLGAVAW